MATPPTDEKTPKTARKARSKKEKVKRRARRREYDDDLLARRDVLAALRAFKRGDFTVRLPDDLSGIDGDICQTFNEVVIIAQTLGAEVEQLRSAVGREGNTRRRLPLATIGGGWTRYVKSVNDLLDDLTDHTDEIARVVDAVARGDLNQRIDLDRHEDALSGDFLRHARTVNGMVEQLSRFGSEVTRVAREVGVEGKLGAQAEVPGVSGTWKELANSVNLMASNLTNQVRDISQVATAIAQGDLSRKITVEVRGELLELKNTINTMVDQLSSFADEVTRVAREVGVEGKLGGQAEVRGVSGIWRELTDNVNLMGSNLTEQVRGIAEVTTAVANGDLSKKISVEVRGEILELKNTINTMVDQLSSFADEVTRVAREVGTDGILGGQAEVRGVSGVWRELTQNVNSMASNLTNQVRNITEVTSAVANGDLSKKITVDARGEVQDLKETINAMVDQLNAFGAEVTRVARDVGVEGKLGGQAEVAGVRGIWKELTDNVNLMASNLTNQVRDIAEVTTAVANGDLSKKITVEVRGEILELKNTINTMVDQLSSFADEVTRVAREVGTDGILGGQAEVRGVSGVWRELTRNVNSMASNLTNQVRNIAEVTTAIAEGDLSKKITVDAKGEILNLKNTINSTVDKLNHFSAEVTRVARLVGTEGTLGVQAEVHGVSGIWKELTDNVNLMGRNLTDQVRDIAEVTTAVANGDLSRKITVEVRGEILQLKNTINAMVDSLGSFADEVTRVAREVGTDGVLGGQAEVHGASGIWKELTNNVNSMGRNLTNQVRNIAEVASAVANGDLSKKITVDARGEVQDLKETINAMVDQLNAFGAEVTRVAREVGVEGKLGGQATVAGVRGIWKELTDNVNLMASNLTNQVRGIAEVTTAVANGDLTRKIVVDAKGEILELKNTINTMVDQLSSFADEVTRLASEVGVEGKLGGQADVRGVSGTWRDLTDAVNSMASNLTAQVRSISQVATAIAEGDLRKKIEVDAKGEILELKDTINTMVDQLSSFADEVTRVSREVGVEGKLGGQAEVRGVSGIWKELTDNVNLMGRNLTNQVRNIAEVTTAVANGDLSKKITVEVRGEILELKNTINTMVDQLSSFADEVTRVARDVGVEGKLGGQAEVRGVSGIWKELTDNVNLMASNLTNQVRDIAEVTTAVANGDLSKKIMVEVRGEILELKNTINTMVDQLSSFADEVTRVSREVGVEGKLGGQAEVRGVSGIWRELTDNVNLMASNLTEQVRGIARVVTAVANGDLKQELRLEAKGEIATLVSTINNMIVTLSTFADQVSGVAREVGVEGKLGGQADVPGAAGIWRDLTNNVNELAGNLTRQVRAIGDVATAVTKGDLTQAIDVEAQGELAILKDNINQMIRTLAETTRVNEEQDWLKTNLTRFTRMLQGQRDSLTVSEQVLSELAPVVHAQHGAFYMTRRKGDEAVLSLFASYAYTERRHVANHFRLGEGLVGQAALEKKRIVLTDVPGDYIKISSALGEAPPVNLVVVPILFEGEVKGVIELASFRRFTAIQLDFIEQLLESLGIVVATIEATMRTDELLRQSQTMAAELQSQQEELQQTNDELEEKARQLTAQRDEVARKNREVELAKRELEEKAEELALTSKYKSQFLANMSHELRTPLNSLLILSKKLAENHEGNLHERQVQYADTIHESGADLMALINEILDLAKIESGTMAIDISEVRFDQLEEHVERSFRQLAEETNLDFQVVLDTSLPEALITDDMRLRQVLRNLLSNAFKFTERGRVTLRIVALQDPGELADEVMLEEGEALIAFAVEDTGIGIPRDKQHIIFEAFQQADGGTSRKYGGTGLGLSISREIAILLGGALKVDSIPGTGSTFTLCLPETYKSRKRRPRLSGVTLAAPTRAALRAPDPERDAESSMPAIASVVRSRLPDDRNRIEPGDRLLLVVEDDEVFAGELLEAARRRGFRGIVAGGGEEALEMARSLTPDAITLDLRLPDMDGWVLLDRLKHDPATRHVPVHIISAMAERTFGLHQGAVAVASKPLDDQAIEVALDEVEHFLTSPARRIVVIVDDPARRQRLRDLLTADDDIEIATRDTAEEVLSELDSEELACVVTDLSKPIGAEAARLVRSLAEQSHGRVTVPLVVAVDDALPSDLRNSLDEIGQHRVVAPARSPEHLLELTVRFLHRSEAALSDERRQMLRSLAWGDPSLRGHKVLVVDDDIRNIFAITAVLEQHDMEVVYAENGFEALDTLREEDGVDIVLMDIMMPEMDGYEATRRIRAQSSWAHLPIIALTAKAMRGDREKCIQAGASDYVTKPVEAEQLVSLMRVWLTR